MGNLISASRRAGKRRVPKDRLPEYLQSTTWLQFGSRSTSQHQSTDFNLEQEYPCQDLYDVHWRMKYCPEAYASWKGVDDENITYPAQHAETLSAKRLSDFADYMLNNLLHRGDQLNPTDNTSSISNIQQNINKMTSAKLPTSSMTPSTSKIPHENPNKNGCLENNLIRSPEKTLQFIPGKLDHITQSFRTQTGTSNNYLCLDHGGSRILEAPTTIHDCFPFNVGIVASLIPKPANASSTISHKNGMGYYHHMLLFEVSHRKKLQYYAYIKEFRTGIKAPGNARAQSCEDSMVVVKESVNCNVQVDKERVLITGDVNCSKNRFVPFILTIYSGRKLYGTYQRLLPGMNQYLTWNIQLIT